MVRTKVSEDPTEVQKWLTNTQGSLMLQILSSFNRLYILVTLLYYRHYRLL